MLLCKTIQLTKIRFKMVLRDTHHILQFHPIFTHFTANWTQNKSK